MVGSTSTALCTGKLVVKNREGLSSGSSKIGITCGLFGGLRIFLAWGLAGLLVLMGAHRIVGNIPQFLEESILSGWLRGLPPSKSNSYSWLFLISSSFKVAFILSRKAWIPVTSEVGLGVLIELYSEFLLCVRDVLPSVPWPLPPSLSINARSNCCSSVKSLWFSYLFIERV